MDRKLRRRGDETFQDLWGEILYEMSIKEMWRKSLSSLKKYIPYPRL